MQAPTKRLRLAVIGGGLFARNNHIPQLLKLHDLIEVVAVWSNSKASAELAAALFPPNSINVYYEVDEDGVKVAGKSYADILARQDIDAVDLVVSIDGMPEFVDQALRVGKHVISEKPVAPNIEIGAQLVKKYREEYEKQFPGLVWSVAEQLWYEPCWNMIKDYRVAGWKDVPVPVSAETASGSSNEAGTPALDVIGKPLVATLTRVSAMNNTNKYYVTKWRATPSYQGGYLLDGGVHEVCKLRMMFGEIQEVTAMTEQFRADLPPADSMTCSLRFESGVLCNWTYTFTAITPPIAVATVPYDMLITGSAGSIQAKNNELVLNFVSPVGDTQRHISIIDNELGQLSIRRELETFALSALGSSITNGFSPYSPEQALQDVAVIQSLLESAKTASRISVPSFIS